MVNYHIIESEAIFLRTKISLDVIFPLNKENNIHDFVFFTQFGQLEENFVFSVYVVPRYSIDGTTVRNIKTSYELSRILMPEEILGFLGTLKNLQNTVNDFNSTTDELNQKYYNSIYNYFQKFGTK